MRRERERKREREREREGERQETLFHLALQQLAESADPFTTFK